MASNTPPSSPRSDFSEGHLEECPDCNEDSFRYAYCACGGIIGRVCWDCKHTLYYDPCACGMNPEEAAEWHNACANQRRKEWNIRTRHAINQVCKKRGTTLAKGVEIEATHVGQELRCMVTVRTTIAGASWEDVVDKLQAEETTVKIFK